MGLKDGQGGVQQVMMGMALPTAVSADIWEMSSSIIGIDAQPLNVAHALVLSVELSLLRGGWPTGQGLGRLIEVSAALGPGRPACREAITILQARGVLDVRRGRGGGIFVGVPSLEDAAAATLLYLAAAGTTRDCVLQFRLSVWRMIVEAAVSRGIRLSAQSDTSDDFAAGLAGAVNNPAMIVAAELAEMLVRACDGPRAGAYDALLDRALAARDLERALRRLDDLSGPPGPANAVGAIEGMGKRLSDLGRNAALTLAGRMLAELGRSPRESEWQTADRLGYTPDTVRRARRVLEDLGLVHCRQGRRGAIRSAAANPASVIRLLAPCLVASGMTATDNSEAAYYLACSAPAMAAQREAGCGSRPVKRSAPDESVGFPEILRFENFLLDQCGNPLLGILVRALGLAGISTAAAPFPELNGGDLTALNELILEAIENGDPEAAAGLARTKALAMPPIAEPFFA